MEIQNTEKEPEVVNAQAEQELESVDLQVETVSEKESESVIVQADNTVNNVVEKEHVETVSKKEQIFPALS